MNRNVLGVNHVHPLIREKIAHYYSDVVDEVESAIALNIIVIVGMGQNPFPRKARKLLDSHNIPYKYLAYGNYLSQWRRRSALKMWTGWPTFPMVFVKGILIGGATDLEALLKSGELAKMLTSR
jgi:monothiol glutaredoxin